MKKTKGGLLIIPSIVAAVTTGVVLGKKRKKKAEKIRKEVADDLREQMKTPQQKMKEAVENEFRFQKVFENAELAKIKQKQQKDEKNLWKFKFK